VLALAYQMESARAEELEEFAAHRAPPSVDFELSSNARVRTGFSVDAESSLIFGLGCEVDAGSDDCVVEFSESKNDKTHHPRFMDDALRSRFLCQPYSAGP
jgi:hypothetical protein